jgi:type II secretory pathway component PulF
VRTDANRSLGRRSVTVRTRDLSQFYRQMASMLKSGVSLPQALTQIVSYIQDRQLRQAVEDLQATVDRGRPMSDAMERHPRVFSAGHIGLIRSGQSAGYLDRAFAELANQSQADWDVQTSIRFNPILFILKVVGIPFLVMWVMFMQSFSQWQTNASLIPHFLARAAIGAGGTFVFIVVLFPTLSHLVRLSPFGRVIESIAMFTPGVNARRKRVDRFKTLTSLASALNAGVPNTIAWNLAAESADTDFFQRKMQIQTPYVTRGTGIPDAMEHTGLFTPQIMQLVRSGELAGNLPEMLTQASTFEREEAKHLGALLPWVFAALAYLAFLIIAGYLFINAAAGVYGGMVDKT